MENIEKEMQAFLPKGESFKDRIDLAKRSLIQDCHKEKKVKRFFNEFVENFKLTFYFHLFCRTKILMLTLFS